MGKLFWDLSLCLLKRLTGTQNTLWSKPFQCFPLTPLSTAMDSSIFWVNPSVVYISKYILLMACFFSLYLCFCPWIAVWLCLLHSLLPDYITVMFSTYMIQNEQPVFPSILLLFLYRKWITKLYLSLAVIFCAICARLNFLNTNLQVTIA